MAKVNRKLATILATDCVDFSKHMESQEELTLSNLTSCRAIMDPIIEEYGGRIFHTAGDSVIAEFGSPVECVNAAMEFQGLLAARNEAIVDGLKLEWRVGIHVDDVDVVIHYNPPEDHKTYLHRSGRTARAGNSGTAVTMFLWDEELQVRQLQRRLGIKLPFHDVFSNDDSLDELASWAQNQN